MNSNQNNDRGKGGGSKRNTTAIISIILWALVLTLLVNVATSRFQQANSVEVLCPWPAPPTPWRSATASSAS